MIEAPLLLRLQDFENRHDAIFAYIFSVYTAAQKQFFFECSTAMAVFPSAMGVEAAPSVPLILNHGSRSDIDEVKSAIQRQNQAAQQAAQQAQQAQPVEEASVASKPVSVDVAPEPMPMAQPVPVAQPVQVMQPMQPMQPMEPMQPMQPMQPIQPMQPMQPIQPMQPVQPMQPMEPMQPVQPMQPMEPVQPVDLMTAPQEETKAAEAPKEEANAFDFAFPSVPTNTPAPATNEQPAATASEPDFLSGF